MREIGERVGAILSAAGNTVKLIGYGVYNGNHIPTEAAGWIAEAMREAGRTNPQIKLDSGQVVYGCECWWGSEEATKKRVEAYPNVIQVDIDEERARVLAELAKSEEPT